MKKDVAIRENHDLYFKKEIIEMNVLYINTFPICRTIE